MSALFEIKINSIRTTTVGELNGVIKSVELTVKGSEDGQSFELPQTITLSDPESESFLPLEQVTEQAVMSWIESNFTNLDAVKSHIQYVLDKEVEKSKLTETKLPWAVEEAAASQQ